MTPLKCRAVASSSSPTSSVRAIATLMTARRFSSPTRSRDSNRMDTTSGPCWSGRLRSTQTRLSGASRSGTQRPDIGLCRLPGHNRHGDSGTGHHRWVYVAVPDDVFPGRDFDSVTLAGEARNRLYGAAILEDQNRHVARRVARSGRGSARSERSTNDGAFRRTAWGLTAGEQEGAASYEEGFPDPSGSTSSITHRSNRLTPGAITASFPVSLIGDSPTLTGYI